MSALFLLFFAFSLDAQRFWTDISENAILRSGERRIVPDRYRTVAYNLSTLRGIFDQAAQSGAHVTLEIPVPDGGTARFVLQPSAVMAPGLQAKYPEIRCFSGVGIDDPTARLKCDLTPWGFHAMILAAEKDPVFIDPYSQGDAEHGVVYFKKDYRKRSGARYACALTGHDIDPETSTTTAQSRSVLGPDGQARLYRLALACTGEYASFHGGAKPLVMAAMVTSMNRVNGVYENEFAVSMQIIAGNDTLIFLDSSTDPYDNEDGGTMLGQNKTTCNQRIGSPGYDMGHVFSTGGGGIAGLGVVCTNNKAQGVTGQESPIGDPFDIDYVAHEMGHQFAGNHTQNNNCNRNGSTSVEPGSASTIMGYAGICDPDVQPHSDAYFHGINVAEVIDFITAGDGDGCPVKTPTGNSAPLVEAGPNYTIPKSTPFALTAIATDAESNNTLTYCWEQMDAEVGTMPPKATSTKGPLFRSYNPVLSPTRYFPNLPDLLNQVNNDWEELPGVGRQMKFRVTVRDNFVGGGSTVFDDMALTVSAAAGPFKVTTPDAVAVWQGGSFQDVKWDVANTDKTPVSCAQVRILLSLDGGFTYPYVLAENVPNTGQYCVLAPDTSTNSARVKVESVGNVFFNVSIKDFAIEAATQPAFSFCPGAFNAQICLPSVYQTSISTRGQGGFDAPVTFSAANLPAGAVATFSPNPAQPGADVDFKIDLPAGTPEGAFAVQINAETASGPAGAAVTNLTVVSNDFSALALELPANGANNQPQGVILRWNGVADANQYELQVGTSPSFDASTIIASHNGLAVDTFKIPVILAKSKLYYWRIRPKNECGTGVWTDPFVFSAAVENCFQRTANDLPKTISANGTPTIESKIDIPAGATISDVNIVQIKGTHEFFKDLQATLISPQGTSVLLFKDKCGGFNGSFNFGFDDAAASVFACPPPNNGLGYQGFNPLSVFNGQNSTGIWTLQLKDNAAGSAGTFTDFKLEFCELQATNPPFIVQNNPLQLSPGSNAGIPTSLLQVSDANNTPPQLLFTVMTPPKHGELQKGGVVLQAGGQFTQADVDNGLLQYFDYGLNAGDDAFRFSATDGEGGMVTDIFRITPLPVGTNSPDLAVKFTLAPNPAAETVRLSIPEPCSVQSAITLTDLSGRQLRRWTMEAGSTFIQMNLSDLPTGVYIVGLENAQGRGLQKLVLR